MTAQSFWHFTLIPLFADILETLPDLPVPLHRFQKHRDWPDPEAPLAIKRSVHDELFASLAMGSRSAHFVFATLEMTIPADFYFIHAPHPFRSPDLPNPVGRANPSSA